MEVNRSGYYRYLKEIISVGSKKEENLIIELKALHKKSDKSYGSRRLSKGLKAKGYDVGRYRVRSLMREMNIICKQRRRFRITTHSNHAFPISENVLNREFSVPAPNHTWVADITYIWTHEGWLYLAGVLDLFSRRVVGWSLASHLREDLVRDALLMAIGRRTPRNELLHHSDRGCQYVLVK